MTKEESHNMQIANCRICMLTQSHCAECPLNWALNFVEMKIIEIPLKINIEIQSIEI